jgi:hypothetical protein
VSVLKRLIAPDLLTLARHIVDSKAADWERSLSPCSAIPAQCRSTA